MRRNKSSAGRESQVVELYGELAGTSTDEPPGWPCGRDRSVAGCPDAGSVGHLILGGQVVAVTSDTEVYGCGPNDGRERRQVNDLFRNVDGRDTAWAQVRGDGPTLHALRVHIGYCG